MKIVLTRVDGRLIHGQVAVAWTRTTGAEHIMVIHDQSAKDEMQKMLLELATPSGVSLSILTVKEGVEKLKSGALTGKYMLLFKNPHDIITLLDQGVELTEVNIGGMYHEDGKEKIDNALFVGEDDRKVLKELSSRGVHLYYQVAPMNAKEDLAKKLGF
ncbi:PTS system mannose/fructose/N-acetylgalactosamine-transporter subunit IIB [Aneurinibacillus terranovensis]|uniref:PTS system mannose/fructose/N-acetylgalactosamine-transporter subunit IIB n=1 Tax=Aneurinibacillus terranovensis TaxID=278991 RepID=UPI00042A054E|nr:PTS sugar transporter subunit IIB [Aneurinibacillus terranovensis]